MSSIKYDDYIPYGVSAVDCDEDGEVIITRNPIHRCSHGEGECSGGCSCSEGEDEGGLTLDDMEDELQDKIFMVMQRILDGALDSELYEGITYLPKLVEAWSMLTTSMEDVGGDGEAKESLLDFYRNCP